MKKLIALLMAMTMMFCVTACGGKGTSSDGLGTDGSAKTDMEYVQDKGTLVVGITDFAPMDYRDKDGNWIGFDAELAAAFAESLGVEVEFVEIEWGNKAMELSAALQLQQPQPAKM